jgi:hypothetical protein
MPGHWWAAAGHWYTSATFLTVLGLVVSLLSSVGTWLTLVAMNPKRRLLFGIRAVVPMVTAPEELRNDLQVFHRRTRLTEPRLVEIQFVGRGRRDIPASLFEGEPIRLAVGPQIVRVLKVTSSEPSRPLPKVVPDGTSLLIRPSVIGKRQEICINLLVDGPQPQLTWQSPLPDVDVRPLTGGDLSPSRTLRAARVATIVLVSILVGLAVPLMTPTGRRYALGVDQPIELRPLCENLGGIVAPPAERDAAFHYRCAESTQTITRAQIEGRCKDQWGSGAQLVLRDRNSASGWKCHAPGWLR